MDLVERIASIAFSIYSLIEEVKANKERSRRVARRVKGVVALMRKIKKQNLKDVEESLKEFQATLISAKELLQKYTSTKIFKRVMNVRSIGDDFDSLNDRLDDAYSDFALALNLETHDVISRMEEDQTDRRKDDAEMRKWLNEELERKQAEIKQLQEVKDDLEQELETLKNPTNRREGAKEIKPEELKYDHPKQLIMKTSSSEVYKAEYHGFAVAVKRFITPLETNPNKVRKAFWRETENMRQFESPSVLRMFGICVQDEAGPNQQFLIIMEYCERGTLRHVLDSSVDLPWPLKGRMCLDAAEGLCRLHRQEAKEKSKVLTAINSSKFLVDRDYRVKLGGLELAKTETSLLRSNSQGKNSKSSSVCYICPEKLKDINLAYNKKCEMFSFGIILWEIATRKKPFEGDSFSFYCGVQNFYLCAVEESAQGSDTVHSKARGPGCSREEIRAKVLNVETYQEPLPADCPESLAELINACRAYDGFDRPTSGVLLDKLRTVVGQMEAK